ncbi:GNAT family N-acetyltransferase [Bacillus lacus]|uniref:GNAT family N-acetyltransferase n=1 Tax=Metabacillus lacus TaxID=1983721 RepID=A0A7X2LYW2_9BACI|nr:GNAT family N-acetyltransferase [Metabacillus lacus]MRX72248.1 GNAT family N-acetyltransferase [Metabacillus lacus]
MFRKELYVYDGQKQRKIIIRNYQEKDFQGLIKIQRESFPPPFPEELLWNENQLTNHIQLFPEGSLCAEADGRIIGSITSLRIDYTESDKHHTWDFITDNGYISTHKHNGNTLYVVDICVSPAYRKLKVGKWLLQSLYETVVHLRLDRLLGGGRMPGYHTYKNELSPEEYVHQVVNGTLRDPVISFLLSCGRTPVSLVENYLDDEESCNYGLLMEWKNPLI